MKINGVIIDDYDTVQSSIFHWWRYPMVQRDNVK